MSHIACLAQKLFTLEANDNSWRLRIETDAVAAENWFTTCDLLEQFATFNVLCQRHTANRDILSLCSGRMAGPHAVLTLRGVRRGVSTLGALKVATLLLDPPHTLLADEVHAAQEVGVS